MPKGLLMSRFTQKSVLALGNSLQTPIRSIISAYNRPLTCRGTEQPITHEQKAGNRSHTRIIPSRAYNTAGIDTNNLKIYLAPS